MERGVLALLIGVIANVASTGVLFGGGHLAGSGFFSVASMLTAYSQMPHVKYDFRVKKAISMCQEGWRTQKGMLIRFHEWDCKIFVESLNDRQVLAFIKDDIMTGNGGNFRNGYMN